MEKYASGVFFLRPLWHTGTEYDMINKMLSGECCYPCFNRKSGEEMTVTKMSLACIAVLAYAGWFYYKNRRVPLQSARLFNFLYLTALINLVADGVTVYTVNHLDSVPEWLNYLWHLLFLLSIDVFLFLLYRYMFSYVQKVKNIGKKAQLLHCLPFLVSAVLILFLPITYITTPQGNYSLGPKAYALYASTLYYIVLIVYYNLHYWKELNKDKREAILSSMVIFVSVSLLQIFFPALLITGPSITLIVLGLMMSNENPEKYLDVQTGLFNRYALMAVLDEWSRTRGSFYVGVAVIDELLNGSSKLSVLQDQDYIAHLDRRLRMNFKLSSYRIADNGIAFLSQSEKECSRIFEFLEKNCCGWDTPSEHLEGTLRFKQLRFPQDGRSFLQLIKEITSFCMDNVNRMAYMDSLTRVRNRNAFEIDLRKPRKAGCEYWYLIVDANNLKAVNDTLGHSFGDELLQAIAKLLTTAVGKEGRVYRIGGDEFAVLWEPGRPGTIEQFLDKIRRLTGMANAGRMVVLDFAIGCADLWAGQELEKAVQAADEMMYREKAVMKPAGMRP